MDIEEQLDKIASSYAASFDHEMEQVVNFRDAVVRSQKTREKLEQLNLERARLEEQVKLANARKAKLEHLVGSSIMLVERERGETKRAEKQRDRMKRRLEETKKLILSADIPENAKIEVLNKCKRVENISHTDTLSDSSISCSITDSDSWHLFADGPAPSKRKSYSLASTGSSHSNASHLTDGDEANSVVWYTETFDSIMNRAHEYIAKNLVLGETCCVCELRIKCGRQALRCTSCRAIVHQKCQERLAKPCVPTDVIKPGNRDIKYFCTMFKPMIPGIIFHCVQHIERNGLEKQGLFVLPVYDANVTRLKELFFKNRGVPNLEKFDVMVVSAFLKDFLASLTPPLIPSDSFKEFLKYGNISSKGNHSQSDAMNDLYQLPCPNRDTLAFLILLFQKVVASPACKLNSYYLAKIFTPILTENVQSHSYKIVKNYAKVIQAFIDMPEDLWKRLLMSSLQ